MKKRGFLVLLLAVVTILTAVLPIGAAYDTTTLNKAISYKGVELNDPIDGMWQGFMEDNDNKGFVKSNQDGISGDGNSIKLAGYQSGGNVQYAYQDTSEIHNKLIKFKMKFDGEFVSPDGSFLSLVLRSSGFSTKFYWDQPCYAILIKGGKVEAQKFPAFKSGVPNNLGGTKGKTPIVKPLAKPFTPGTYDVEVGAIDGISPTTKQKSVNLILKLNGKEVLNVWDDSGRTPVITQKGYFMISLAFTQKDIDGDHSSRSSITLMKVGASAATPAVKSTETKVSTTDSNDSKVALETNTAAASTQIAADSSQAAASTEESQTVSAAVSSQAEASTTADSSSTAAVDSSALTNSEASNVDSSGTVATSTSVATEKATSSNSLIWIVIGIIALAAIGFVLYFVSKRKRTK